MRSYILKERFFGSAVIEILSFGTERQTVHRVTLLEGFMLFYFSDSGQINIFFKDTLFFKNFH